MVHSVLDMVAIFQSEELGAKIILRSNDQIFDDIPVDQTLHNLDANLLIMSRDNIQRDEINPVAADL